LPEVPLSVLLAAAFVWWLLAMHHYRDELRPSGYSSANTSESARAAAQH
jgi:hypothetical protein